jgi:hypothetical protein
VWRCCFLPGSQQLASAGADAALKAWPLQAWLAAQQQQQLVPVTAIPAAGAANKIENSSSELASAGDQQEDSSTNYCQQQQQQQQLLVPVVRQFSFKASCSSSSSSSRGPPAAVNDSRKEAVIAMCLAAPNWLLVATKQGRLHAAPVDRQFSDHSRDEEHTSVTGDKQEAGAAWQQLYACSADAGPVMAMAQLASDLGSSSSSSTSTAGSTLAVHSRVATGHLRGQVTLLAVRLPLHGSSNSSSSSSPDSNAVAMPANSKQPGADAEVTTQAAAAAAAAAESAPSCTLAAAWQAHDAASPVAGVFAVAALGAAGLVTSAAAAAPNGGSSVSRRWAGIRQLAGVGVILYHTVTACAVFLLRHDLTPNCRQMSASRACTWCFICTLPHVYN